MYFILTISPKAFIKLEDNGDITVVQDPERASRIGTVGDAMRAAAQINEDWEENIVKFLRIG